MGKLVHYFIAQTQLKERFDSTPEEIAMWIWLGAIKAYVDGSSPRQEFFFDYVPEEGFNYVEKLVDLSFDQEELDSFEPSERFRNYEGVIERFEKYISKPEAESLVFTLHKKGEIASYHPLAGGAEDGSSANHGSESRPGLQDAMYSEFEIERIEHEKLPDSPQKGETSLRSTKKRASSRNAKLQKAANALAAKWNRQRKRGFSKRDICRELAKTEDWLHMQVITIERNIKVKW